MSEPQNWDMLARFLAGEASPEEANEIQTWIDSDPENAVMVDRLRTSYSIASEEDASDLNVMWSKIARDIGRSKYGIARAKSRTGILEWIREAVAARPIWVPVAAMGVLLAIAWLPYHYIWNASKEVTVAVPFGERKVVELHDGSRIVLDAGSRLEYPEQFAADSRKVTLYGQGYFQVARDASRPFVVTAGHGQVEVLGTAFDIQSWNESSVVVSVEDGRVRFGRAIADAGQSVVLIANQTSSIEGTSGPTPPTHFDVSRQLAWTRDEVFYDDAPLSLILDRLHRWHNLDFTVANPALLDERLTVHLRKSDLDGSINLLSRLLDLDASRNAGAIRLTQRSVK